MTSASSSMTRKVFVVSPDTPLSSAWALMTREGFRHLPVVSDGTLIGLLSDRDVLLRATLSEGAFRVPDTPVGEAATPCPYVCAPETEVGDVICAMLEKRLDAVPVVEAGDRWVGLVTTTDLLELLLQPIEAKIPLPFSFEVEYGSAVAPV